MQADEALREVEYLSAIGIQWRLGVEVGRDVSWEDLEAEYDAIFLGLGLGHDARLGVPGEELPGVWGASHLIEAIKTGSPLEPGELRSAVVVGGGNTAIDAARELALLGVPEVRLVYRRGPAQIPAYRHERDHAIHEGVRFVWNAHPVEFLGNGRLEGVRLARLDEALKPVGESWVESADVAAIAVGQGRLVELLNAIGGLEHERGRVFTDPVTGQTSNPRYWAGGDLANGGAEVVNAAAEGKRAAHGIDAWLRAGKER
jgi:glutamate synthase (NADPH/NADH) small chain